MSIDGKLGQIGVSCLMQALGLGGFRRIWASFEASYFNTASFKAKRAISPPSKITKLEKNAVLLGCVAAHQNVAALLWMEMIGAALTFQTTKRSGNKCFLQTHYCNHYIDAALFSTHQKDKNTWRCQSLRSSVPDCKHYR